MNISDELLLSSYYKAVKRKLDSDFIKLLKEEIDRRNLEVTDQDVLFPKPDHQE